MSPLPLLQLFSAPQISRCGFNPPPKSGPVRTLAPRLLVALGLLIMGLGLDGCKRSRIRALRVPAAPTFFDTSPLHVAAFDHDSVVQQHIVQMPFGEAAARLGALHFETHTKFDFVQEGGRNFSQSDRGSIHYDSGGNLHVTQATPAARIEMLAIDDRVFVRYDTGQMRRKTRRDLDVDEWPQRAFAGLSQVLELLAPIKFSEARSCQILGRNASRFGFGLDSDVVVNRAQPTLASAQMLLPMPPPGRWREVAKPQSLAGTLVIDDATGVVLSAELDARLQIRTDNSRPISLTLHVSHTITEIARAAPVRPPERAVAEYRRPIRPKDPLNFFRNHLGDMTATPLSGGNANDDEEALRPGAPPPAAPD